MQQVLVGVGLGATLAAVGFLGLQFFTPETPLTHRVVDLGAVEEFEPGSVTTFVLAEGAEQPYARRAQDLTCEPSVADVVIHVARLEGGDFRALTAESSHMGELVQWAPEMEHSSQPAGEPPGVFFEPCHDDVFLIDGTRLYGPAPRDLAQYQVRVEDGRVLVDPRNRTEGALRVTTHPPGSSPPTSTAVPVPRTATPEGR